MTYVEVWGHTMTINAKSSVFYLDFKDNNLVELFQCTKTNIDESFDKLKLPDSCIHYLSKSRCLLKSLAEYDLGANVVISRDNNDNIETKVIELVDYSNTEDDVLSPSRSVIALFVMFGTEVDYSLVVDPSKHKIKVLEEITAADANKALLRYTNLCEATELDVTFVYAICEYDSSFFRIRATYDLESNVFKDKYNETVNNPFITNVKEDYEKLFRRE